MIFTDGMMDERLQSGSPGMSRRRLFGALVRPFTRHLEEGASGSVDDGRPKVAVIQGGHCLAYQGGVCFTCSERCPEPGVITTKQGVPTVHVGLCTGCGVCVDLCPAPTNAILMLVKPEAVDVGEVTG